MRYLMFTASKIIVETTGEGEEKKHIITFAQNKNYLHCHPIHIGALF